MLSETTRSKSVFVPSPKSRRTTTTSLLAEICIPYQSSVSEVSMQPSMLVTVGSDPCDLAVAVVLPASPAVPASLCTAGQGARPPVSIVRSACFSAFGWISSSDATSIPMCEAIIGASAERIISSTRAVLRWFVR